MNSRLAPLKVATDLVKDNTTITGGSGTEELVPSRYAVNVGDVEVLVVSDGVLPLPTLMLGHNADPAAHRRTGRSRARRVHLVVAVLEHGLASRLDERRVR